MGQNVPPTPPSVSPISIGLRPWHVSPFASPPLRAISPNSKPALSRQRDHSACGRPETPLKVRKTRENLRDTRAYPELPPPCSHSSPHHCRVSPHHDAKSIASTLPSYHTDDRVPAPQPPAATSDRPKMLRHKSVSRRMLSKVKNGINNRSKGPLSIRPVESETSLMRRLSGRRKQSAEADRRAQSFEISRDSVISMPEEDLDAMTDDAYCGQRSCTDSTVSTSELMVDLPSAHGAPIDILRLGAISAYRVQTPPLHDVPFQPSPGLTPRPPVVPPLTNTSPAVHRLVVPCVELTVFTDSSVVDAGAEQDVWVAVEATVRGKMYEAPGQRHDNIGSADTHTELVDFEDLAVMDSVVLGAITTLRLCYKPVGGCLIKDVIGQKAMKDLRIGHGCTLFIRIRIPKIKLPGHGADPDQSSVLAELESIVGTLETELLHVEARYRSSLLPYSNVVTVRHVTTIRRPKTESRWSVIATYSDIETSEQMYTKLAIYLADTYPPEKTLRYIDRHLADYAYRDPIKQIRARVADELAMGLNNHADDGPSMHEVSRPTVIVTDIDPVSAYPSTVSAEEYATAPCTPTTDTDILSTCGTGLATPAPRTKSRSTSMFALSPYDQSVFALPGSRSSVSVDNVDATAHTDAKDDARRLWHHIRRSSLSARQILDVAPELQHLEAGDEALRELRRRALANKRSVGAETLKEWKWDRQAVRKLGEAPWM